MSMRRPTLLSLWLALLLVLLPACGGTADTPPAATSAPAAQATSVPAAPTTTEAPTTAAATTSAPAPLETTEAPTTAAANEPLQIIATFSILGDLVQNVAGDAASVQTLVGPDGDPHVYEPTPADSVALAEADLIFENGLEFETWIDDLYSASGSQAKRVVVTDGIEPLAASEGHSHGDEDPLTHACEHFEDPPEQIATGGAIPDDHTHYEVALTGGEGSITLTHAEDAEVSFFLAADVPFTLAAGDTSLEPESLERIREGCDAIAIVYTFDLAPGDYRVSFGPEAGDRVALVWEVAEEHGHDEEAHAEETGGTAAAGTAEAEEHDHGEEAHAEGEHSHGEYDPHVWNDPNNAMLMVEAIRDALVAADSANAATYEANAEAYLAELRELDAFVEEETAKLPAERRKLVTTHDTFGYFADRYGYEVVGTALGSVSTEAADPAAGEIAELVGEIQAAGVPAIFAESSNNPQLMERIAEEAGVELAPALYPEALSEADGPAATYLDLVRHNVSTIVTALAG